MAKNAAEYHIQKKKERGAVEQSIFLIAIAKTSANIKPPQTHLCNGRLGVDVPCSCYLLELVDQLCHGQTLLWVHLQHRT